MPPSLHWNHKAQWVLNCDDLPFTHQRWATERQSNMPPRKATQCNYVVNLSRANRQSHCSSNQINGADWGLQTLRQACYQENPESAMCVQSFDDSRGLAIRITYRISLRSSSLWEPRHPLLKVVMICFWVSHKVTGSH